MKTNHALYYFFFCTLLPLLCWSQISARQWNEAAIQPFTENQSYWQFEDLVRTAQNKNIIVQIEVWDRFDHSRKEWLSDPWNPLIKLKT